MTSPRPLLASVALALAITACSSQPTHDQVVTAEEIAALQPLRAEYDNAVTGFIVKGNQLDVSIDLNTYSTIDEDDVPLLQAEVVRRWREAWTAQHPREHAELTVRFVDYHGRPFLIKKIRV
jgi:hypothetical protein